MFKSTKPKYQLMLEDEIEQQLRRLKSRLDGEEYVQTLNYVERLHKMMGTHPSPVSKDTLVTVGANLLGIMLILKHEWAHPITSKALGFVIRPR